MNDLIDELSEIGVQLKRIADSQEKNANLNQSIERQEQTGCLSDLNSKKELCLNCTHSVSWHNKDGCNNSCHCKTFIPIPSTENEISEFNLSDKIINGDIQDIGNAVLDVQDVKEFIRILKIKINQLDEGDGWLLDELDSLTGDKFKQ